MRLRRHRAGSIRAIWIGPASAKESGKNDGKSGLAGSTFIRVFCGSKSLGWIYLEYDDGISNYAIIQGWCSVDTLEIIAYAKELWPSN